MKNNVKNKTQSKLNEGWCFAIVNGRLAEIYFKRGSKIYGHAYVERDEFSKREQKMIDKDIEKHIFSYRNSLYYDKLRKRKYEKSSSRNL
jgi:hypothetical protein